MDGTDKKVRYVRCAKCLTLLIEFSDIPVYKCGGCGAILRAKYYSASKENGALGPVESNKPSNLPSNGSSETAIALGEQITPSSSAETLTLSSSSSNSEDNILKSDLDENIRADDCLNGEAEEPPKLEESPESLSRDVALEDDSLDGVHGERDGECLLSPTQSSRDYGGSESPFNYSKEREGGVVLERPRLQDLPLKSFSHKHMERFGSSKEESSSRYGVLRQDRGASLDSSAFFSVLDWTESEFEGDSHRYENDSTSTNFKNLEKNSFELMRKVNELRHQLSELYVQKEGKSRSSPYPNPQYYMMRRSWPQHYQLPKTSLPGQSSSSSLNFHLGDHHSQFPPRFSHSGPCSACAYSSMASNPHSSMTQIHDLDMEKKVHKEKRQTPKRHCRPLSGAAPFVICAKCLKLLQLPADFLISRKRMQKLQCGACSNVLLLSLTCSARMNQTPSKVFDPRSDMDSDTRLSFTPNYSMETTPVLNRSADSYDGREAREGPNFTLHRLMGYDSATELLYQPDDDIEGYESTEPMTSYSYRSEESQMKMKQEEGNEEPTTISFKNE